MTTCSHNKEYIAVNDDDEAAWSEADDSGDSLLRAPAARRHSSWKPHSYCNLYALFLSAVCIAMTILVTIQCTLWWERRGSNAPRYRPAFSPVYDMMNIPLITKYADNSPAPNTSDPNHIYRLAPSPEVDAAWSRIAAAEGIFPATPSDILKMGKDISLAVQSPESWRDRGFPPERPYMMGIEAFHQLHCLNSLRKALVTNYDYYWGSTYGFEPPLTFSRHLNHCVDILRQHLMCHADLEGFTFVWREGQEKPYADFGIRKTCVDFEYLARWSEENRDPRHTELWMELIKPEGVLEEEAPPDLPEIPEDVKWSADGRTPLGMIPGFEGKEYCLGSSE